ncbi:MAG: general secretion pathway protein GspK [Candidatus Omnitrophica bacterium]|nr:general secretion pathway protein GspK [Candidatus Omnitrophota bacterium]
MYFPSANRSGFILITILLFFVLLTVIVAVYLFIATTEMRQAANNLDYAKALALAEAGIEQGIREIRDDVLTTTQTGTADLRGVRTEGSAGADEAERNRVRYYAETVDGYLTMDAQNPGTDVIVYDFDRNYLGTRIKNVEIGVRFRKSSSGGKNPRLDISYTTTGVFPEPGNRTGRFQVSSTSYSFGYVDITRDRSWDWSIINSPNFRIRALARGSSNRDVELDYLFLRVEYEIDTNTEDWYSGFNNITLSEGEIESVDIIDESSKVNINYASRYGNIAFLQWLFRKAGIGSTRAANIATAVVAYRNGPDLRPGVAGVNDDADGFTDETDELGWLGSDDKPFGSIEEIKNISLDPALSQAEFEQIKDYITVYSYVNGYAVRRPDLGSNRFERDAARAPVNINTASSLVLEAIFDTFLGTTLSRTLATEIINKRNIAPFTCFYNSDSSVTTDFYDFIMGLSLTDDQKNRILNYADSSWLAPRADMPDTYVNCNSTEFSYYTNSFLIDAVGKKGNVSRRVKMVIKDDGNKYLDTFLEDSNLQKYWREIP